MKLKCRPIEQAKLGFGDIKSHIAGHLKVAEVVIEDVYPCTPLQEGMMELTAKRPGQYMRYWVFGLKENVDTDRFQHAWNGLAGQMSILRTRVIQILEREMLQVVLNYGPQWSANATEDIDEFLKEERLKPMGLGEPLVRFALVSREKTSERFFVLTMHHAVVDGVSIKILLESAEKLYHNQEVLDSAPFDLFLNHHRDIEIETARYWERKLEGSDPATFPKLPAQNYDPFANEEYRYHMKKAPRLCKDGIQLSTAIWASWAILQAHYTSSRDVVFGVPVSGRQRVPIQGIEKMVAPTVATVPIRAIVDWDITVGDFLQNLQTQTTDMLPFVQVGLRRLRQINPYGDQATRFQTIIGIQRRSVVHPEDDTIVRYDSARSARRLGLFHGNALMIECQIDTDGLYVQISFDSAVMNKSEIIRISQQLEQIVQQVCGGKSQSVLLRDVEILSAKDLQDLQQWNAERPVKINRFVDEIIAENFRARPSAPAICSWDGDLTYGQFDNVTTRLAAHLTKFGVGRGFIVPLCFRRSRWMFIAMLAVIKTGAAFVFLDESLPLARMREIFSQIAARIVLTSKQAHSNLSKLSTIHTIIAADSETWLENDRVSRHSCAEEVNLRGAISTPEDTLYIAFTSGSTGKPKGVVITHSSYASVSLAHKGPMGIDHTSRVLHFASYSFDASNFEALTTFIAGACLCIPSEAMRDNDLGTAINELQANYMFLTPTVSRLLTPADVPSVKTLLTGGEIITKSDISFWSKHVHFKIAYGPTECSAICAVLPDVLDEDAGTIGRGTGASLWIVNPTDHRMLAPVGAVGELVLEGPVIGNCYLGNDEKMGKTFTDQPKWLSKVLPREKIANFPIYLTGDLVQYREDGLIKYIGRKDQQVKLHGQRFELSEVEIHLRNSWITMKDIVAEIITPAGSERILAAFVWMENEGKSSHQDQHTRQEPFAMASAQFQSTVLEVQEILHDSIPSYMVPSLFIPLHYMPMRVSGKVDKTQLCAHAARFSRIELEAFMGVRPNRRGPSTWAEEMIGGLIQDLLKMVDFPGMDDNFFRLGGDSVIAMKLVRRAFDMGITVNVSDIFNFPKLCDLALLSEKRCNGVRPSFDLMATKSPLLLSSSSSGMQISVITDPPAFSMISTKQKAEYFDQILAHSVISLEDVVDMYPCTPLQEGLMSLSVVSPGTYIRRDIFELSSNLDKDLMKNAWSRVISANPILRTRIFQPTSGNQTLQVVLKTSLTWHDYDVNDMTQYLTDSDCKSSMGFMDPLITLAIINARAGKHEANSKRFLSVTLHHAIYDSLSIHLIFDQVEAAYRNYQLRYRPFAPFIEYIERCQRVGGSFWSKQFEGAGEHTTIFPALPVEHYIPRPVDILEHSVECLPTSLGYTPNIHLRAAWAMTMFQYSSSQDVVFGVTVTGRNCEFPGIDQISGPTFATLPLRAIFDPSQTIGEILSSFQRQFTETIPYEQYGLRKIRSLSEDAAKVCQFQSLLLVQPPPHKYEDASHQRQLFTSPLNVAQHRGRSQWDTYAITVECLPQLNGGIDIRAIFDALLISPSTVDRILRTFSHFLLEMSHDISRPIGEIDMISVKDRCQIATWNSSLLKSHDQDISSAMEMCVQSLIRRQCLAAPNSIAVCAWDGDLTYGQLEKQAAILASHLQGMRIGPGSIVPLCFEKSRWTTVAMFGVMKAGAAFVLLDPFSQPLHRMEEICRQVGCKVIISSPANVEIIRAIPSCQIVILEHLIQRPDIASAEFLLPSISPDSALYAVFTSGSTGHPKGIIIEHGGYATSALARQNMFGLHRGSRVLQFASYAFDVSIENNLDTLIAGGCVCVPSETQRTWEFTQIANEYQVTYVDLTPSTSRLLCPSNTPTIETMVLGGEAITKEDVKRWANHVPLLNAYGPAECSVTATIQEIGSDSAVDNTESTSIGQSFPTAATWIVDPSDYTRLLPIGAVGELVIEGPLVGRGYLDASYNPRRFNPFIQETTKWRASFEQLLGSMSSRMYKTGDLVQYNETGSLRYLGRKDQQVKINGQRIELGEIEAKLRIVFSHSTDAICDVIEKRETSQSLLVAFLTDCNDKEVMTSSKDSVIIFSDHQFRSQIGKAQVKLREFLPRYMVPTVFIPVRRIPHTAAGKADRRLLREAASALSHQQLTQFTATREARVPFTVTEKKIQTLWAKVLNIPTDTIDANDGFFHIGGNSILAMKLAALARFDKVKLSMPDLFENSSLESLASALDASAQAPEDASDLYFDWDAEVAIPSTFPVNGYPPRSDSLSDSGVEIILTGCTGHLGGQILRQLICSNYIGHIHCVAVRNPDKVFDGFSENAGGCRTLIRSKVTVYKGDLSLPRIGLSEAAEAKLLANCRAIIHCGALVSFVRSYELLRDVNVGSTKYLASLAVRASMGFHFISTVGVNNIPGYEKGIVEEGSAASTPPPRDGAGGYISSKWVCEVFLELIHQRYGIPLFIHRPSNIVGDGASKDDIINAFLDTSCRIGLVPVLSGWTGYFDLIGIETAARNIVGAMQGTVQSQSQQNSTLEIQYRHETGDAVIPIAGLEKFLEKISGKPVDLVSFEDWVSTARQEQKTSKLMLENLELRKDKGISMPLIRNSRIAWFANGLSPVSRFGTRAGWNAEKDI